MPALSRCLLLCSIFLILSACGQKGPLVLPEDTTTSKTYTSKEN